MLRLQHLMLAAVVAAIVGLAGPMANSADAVIIAAWDDFADATGPFDADDTVAGFTAEISGIDDNRIKGNFGSTDGDYGDDLAGANTAVTGMLVRDDADAVGSNTDNLNVLLTLVNNTGSPYSIDSFHFDFAPRDTFNGTDGDTSPRDFTLTYDSGDLDDADGTAIDSQTDLAFIMDQNQDGSFKGSPADEGDFLDFDYTLSNFLTDTELADGETARFLIVFSNSGDDGAVSGVTDNFAFQGTLVPEPASMALLALGGLCLMPRRRSPFGPPGAFVFYPPPRGVPGRPATPLLHPEPWDESD